MKQGDKEVKEYPDGTLILNHNFPPSEGMSIRERIHNKLGKIRLGFTGEIHTTTFIPIPVETILEDELSKFKEVNDACRDVQMKVIKK